MRCTSTVQPYCSGSWLSTRNTTNARSPTSQRHAPDDQFDMSRVRNLVHQLAKNASHLGSNDALGHKQGCESLNCQSIASIKYNHLPNQLALLSPFAASKDLCFFSSFVSFTKVETCSGTSTLLYGPGIGSPIV